MITWDCISNFRSIDYPTGPCSSLSRQRNTRKLCQRLETHPPTLLCKCRFFFDLPHSPFHK